MAFRQMIELFVFINPLDPECFKANQMIIEFAQERTEKVNIRFVTSVFSQKSLRQLHYAYLKKMQRDDNQIFNADFIASLAVQAATMQGKKRGMQFLMTLQSCLFEQGASFSEALVLEVAQRVNLDLTMFQEDLYSNLAKKAYTRDQHLAQKMHITSTPTCVLYHCNSSNKAIKMSHHLSKETLHQVCGDNFDNLTTQQYNRHTFFQIL
ncbi:DsbA family protein [Dolosigranulum savutiense]|uniref:DsbA family protein n=1 Tax=Dolosigranulum savutiense TaxID=3110288 RepID=A0AB74TTH9_9LACT